MKRVLPIKYDAFVSFSIRISVFEGNGRLTFDSTLSLVTYCLQYKTCEACIRLCHLILVSVSTRFRQQQQEQSKFSLFIFHFVVCSICSTRIFLSVSLLSRVFISVSPFSSLYSHPLWTIYIPSKTSPFIRENARCRSGPALDELHVTFIS